MLEQAAEAARQAAPNFRILDAGVIILVIKAVVEMGRAGLRGWQERSKLKLMTQTARVEEARTLGISMVKDHNGEHKPALVAFCPAHIDMVKQMTTVERDIKHLVDDVVEIKTDVKAIRAAIGRKL